MATTQNLSEVLTQSKLTVVPFPAPKGITQLELELLLSLRGCLHQLQEQTRAVAIGSRHSERVSAALKKESERLLSGGQQ